MHAPDLASPGTTSRRRPRRIWAAAAGLLALAAIGATPTPAAAASGAYGTPTLCLLSRTQKITIQPHFHITSYGYRYLDGYAFFTSAPDLIAVIGEYLYTGGVPGSVITQPDATSGTRLDLADYFWPTPAGGADVKFYVKDAAGHFCYTPPVTI